MPKVIWMRDGYEIPDCEEVRIVDVSSPHIFPLDIDIMWPNHR